MDALIRKVRKAPLQRGDSTGRHEKLAEGWAENKQPVAEAEGVVFYLKYLGSTLVEEREEDETYGDGTSAKAVQRIVAMAKSVGKKLNKVALNVSSKGIHMVDITSKEVLCDLSIYRISFCTADKNFDKVFAFIARNTTNETMECHAFLCAKRKIAQAVTLTVWQAFNVAQDHWEEQQSRKSRRDKHKQLKVSSAPVTPVIQTNGNDHRLQVSAQIMSSPFVDSFSDYHLTSSNSSTGVEVHDARLTLSSTDSSEEESLEDSFSKLAENRGRQRLPSFNTDLRQEDVDEGVRQYMSGRRCFEEFSRQKSIEDLLSL